LIVEELAGTIIVLLTRQHASLRWHARSAKHCLFELPPAVLTLTGGTRRYSAKVKAPSLDEAFTLEELAGTTPASAGLSLVSRLQV